MPVLITGGCGFIGTNLAHRLLSGGRAVHLFDNLTSPGAEQNLQWLREEHQELLTTEIGDVRDWRGLEKALENASEVYHLASQESASSSLQEPLVDFDVNARGTLNLLNAIRESGRQIPLVFASTSKVYGPLSDLKLQSDSVRYSPCDRKFIGVDEQHALDPRRPYGCSKAAADQYVLDFARSYALPTLVLRLGSIYGPHQFGNENQGWVSHLLLRTLHTMPITIFGDGKQVRDILFIEDLVNALLLAQASMDRLKGRAFNIGGGQENTVSLIQFLDLVGKIGARMPRVKFAPWRPGDQRYYASNSTSFQKITRWFPRVGVRQGLANLYRWMVETRQVAPVILATTGA